MTTDELYAAFKRHSETDFLKFDRVSSKECNRPDLHAFILLERFVPGTTDMVSASGHDEILLEVSPEQLAVVANDDIVLELVRCGVRYDNDVESLAMFV